MSNTQITIRVVTPAGGICKKPASKKSAALIRLQKRDVFCVSSEEK